MSESFGHRLSLLSSVAERLCVGIDPHHATLAAWGLTDSAEGVREFQTIMLDHIVAAGIRLAKPQVALFERHGVEGMRVLAQFIQEARSKGVLVIADVKRGDIGTSLAGYAEAWLGRGSDFESDAMTAVAYQGVGSLEPAFHLAAENGKGVFVLAATSNPEGHAIQSAQTSSTISVARQISQEVQERSQRTPHSEAGWLGVVVGATVNRALAGLTDESLDSLSILAPGFGAQGVNLSQVTTVFGVHTPRVIPTVSRSVSGSERAGLADRITRHLDEVS